jgi:hypothetical protein
MTNPNMAAAAIAALNIHRRGMDAAAEQTG